MSLRYTSTLVETVAREAQEVTSNAFRYGWTGGDIGNGTRYVDGIRQLVWLGNTGSREAAAYYAAAAHRWAALEQGTDTPTLPENVAAVVADLNAREVCGKLGPKVAGARADGDDTARHRWSTKR